MYGHWATFRASMRRGGVWYRRQNHENMNNELVEIFMECLQTQIDSLFAVKSYEKYLKVLEENYVTLIRLMKEEYPHLQDFIENEIPSKLSDLTAALYRLFNQAKIQDPLQEPRQQLEFLLVKQYVLKA